MSDRINTIHVFVGLNDSDEEGICAVMAENGTWLPMIAANNRGIDDLREQAQEVANMSGRTVKLIRFAVRSDLEEIRPEG